VTRLRAKNAFATVIGAFESLVGMLAIVSAYLIYYDPDFFAVRTILNLQPEHITFYMLVLFVVGFFSVISGLLIINEWASSY